MFTALQELGAEGDSRPILNILYDTAIAVASLASMRSASVNTGSSCHFRSSPFGNSFGRWSQSSSAPTRLHSQMHGVTSQAGILGQLDVREHAALPALERREVIVDDEAPN